MPPANACATCGAARSDGGARPIAICATRAATSRNVITGRSTSARAARAHRRRVDHSVPHPTLDDTQIRWRTRAGGSAKIAHNVIAIAIAARP